MSSVHIPCNSGGNFMCSVQRRFLTAQGGTEGGRRGGGRTSCYPTKTVVCLHQSQFSTCARTIQSLGNLGHVPPRGGLPAHCTSILKTQEELLGHLHTYTSQQTHPSPHPTHTLHQSCTCSTICAYVNVSFMQVRQEGAQQFTQRLDVA